MADGNGDNPISELDTEETCEGCEVPMTGNCQSCGMPMQSAEQYGGGDEENKYCVNCCDANGSLKSYEAVLEGMAGLMMNSRGLDRSAADKAAGEYLATMPAWSGR